MRGFVLSRCFALALAASCVTTVLAVPRESVAQPQSKADEAKTRYLKGVDLFDEGDYQSALIEFKRSYELVPNFNVLYNIGQVHFQLADYANALRTLQQYLDEGGKRIPASRQTDVARDVEKLRSRVAQVTLKVNVAGAEVRIDDQSSSQPITGPLVVSAGKRRFEVTKPGFKPVTRVEDIAGQENREIVIELLPDAAGTGDGKPPVEFTGGNGRPATPPPEPGPPVAPIVLWSLTGALAVTWGVMGGLALSSDSTLQELKTTPGSSEEDIQTQADQASTFALVSDIMMGATIAAAGVATVFTVLEFAVEDEPANKAAPPAATGRLRFGPGFVGVEGTF